MRNELEKGSGTLGNEVEADVVGVKDDSPKVIHKIKYLSQGFFVTDPRDFVPQSQGAVSPSFYSSSE